MRYKILLLLIIALASLQLNAQIYISGMVTNKLGPSASIGYLSPSNFEIKTGFDSPFRNTDIAKVYYVGAGYMVNLSANEKDNYSVTPTIGIGQYKISQYEMATVDVLKPYANIEFGKDKNLGRFYISATYCGNLYAGIGMRAFIR